MKKIIIGLLIVSLSFGCELFGIGGEEDKDSIPTSWLGDGPLELEIDLDVYFIYDQETGSISSGQVEFGEGAYIRARNGIASGSDSGFDVESTVNNGIANITLPVPSNDTFQEVNRLELENQGWEVIRFEGEAQLDNILFAFYADNTGESSGHSIRNDYVRQYSEDPDYPYSYSTTRERILIYSPTDWIIEAVRYDDNNVLVGSLTYNIKAGWNVFLMTNIDGISSSSTGHLLTDDWTYFETIYTL